MQLGTHTLYVLAHCEGVCGIRWVVGGPSYSERVTAARVPAQRWRGGAPASPRERIEGLRAWGVHWRGLYVAGPPPRCALSPRLGAPSKRPRAPAAAHSALDVQGPRPHSPLCGHPPGRCWVSRGPFQCRCGQHCARSPRPRTLVSRPLPAASSAPRPARRPWTTLVQTRELVCVRRPGDGKVLSEVSRGFDEPLCILGGSNRAAARLNQTRALLPPRRWGVFEPLLHPPCARGWLAGIPPACCLGASPGAAGR